jgi:hypothetical protein
MSAGISVVLTAVFRSFPQTDQTNSEDVHRLGHDCLLQGLSKFNIRLPSYYSTLYRRRTASRNRRLNMTTALNLIILSSENRLLSAGYLVCYSTLKMEAMSSSKQSVSTYRSTWRPIPEDGALTVTPL